jgi:SAM-dependent methyltransferase
MGTMRLSFSAPLRLIHEYQIASRNYAKHAVLDEFDIAHGVETSTRVHRSDLRSSSPNWISCHGYWPTRPDIFEESLSALKIAHEDFVFIDFGSGKGRVLLLASELPFAKVVGLELSSELHVAGLENVERYKSSTQKCRDITSLCVDFTTFQLPLSPLVLYFYNPASRDVMATVAANIARSLREKKRPVFVIYVTPTYDVFEDGKPLALRKIASSGDKFAVYSNAA